MRSRVRERRMHGSVRGLRREPLVYSTVVVREFSGDKTMREAFEQLIERQTCEHFEEWLEHREMAQKAA